MIRELFKLATQELEKKMTKKKSKKIEPTKQPAPKRTAPKVVPKKKITLYQGYTGDDPTNGANYVGYYTKDFKFKYESGKLVPFKKPDNFNIWLDEEIFGEVDE